MNPYLYEHVNIREQASWAHKHDPAGATSKSIRMIAAAVGKLRHAVPLDQIKLPNHRRALVIGGGIAGMKAAADLAGRGIKVLLVEISDQLGGHLNERGQVYPSEHSAEELVAELKRAVGQNANIEVVLSSKVTAVNGFIGNFKVVVESLQTAQSSRARAGNNCRRHHYGNGVPSLCAAGWRISLSNRTMRCNDAGVYPTHAIGEPGGKAAHLSRPGNPQHRISALCRQPATGRTSTNLGRMEG